MKTNISDKTIIIKFAYSDYDPMPETFPNTKENQAKAKAKKIFPRREVTCYAKVYTTDAKTPDSVVEAVVKNDSRTRFESSTARKLSLAKMLTAMALNKSERTVVWNDFFQQCPTTVKFVNKKSVRVKKTSKATSPVVEAI